MVKELVERLNGCNRKGYRRIAKYVDDWFLFDVLLADEDIGRIDAKKVVDRVLDSYNPVTGYVYKRELDRKRSRLVEEILTSVQLQDRQRYETVLHKAANLFFTQSMQYAIDVADETLKEEMERNGITEVVWLTEQDERVCSECSARDGKIYKIDSIPPKPHYNCRCVTVPVFD